jgi:hypothetical protein
MPKLLRPRQEFPTPLFRVFLAVAAPAVGALPGWILIPRWDNPRPYLAILGFACFLIALLVGSAQRLLRAAGFGALGALVVVFAEYVAHSYSQLD